MNTFQAFLLIGLFIGLVALVAHLLTRDPKKAVSKDKDDEPEAPASRHRWAMATFSGLMLATVLLCLLIAGIAAVFFSGSSEEEKACDKACPTVPAVVTTPAPVVLPSYAEVLCDDDTVFASATSNASGTTVSVKQNGCKTAPAQRSGKPGKGKANRSDAKVASQMPVAAAAQAATVPMEVVKPQSYTAPIVPVPAAAPAVATAQAPVASGDGSSANANSQVATPTVIVNVGTPAPAAPAASKGRWIDSGIPAAPAARESNREHLAEHVVGSPNGKKMQTHGNCYSGHKGQDRNVGTKFDPFMTLVCDVPDGAEEQAEDFCVCYVNAFEMPNGKMFPGAYFPKLSRQECPHYRVNFINNVLRLNGGKLRN